jgi:hypothetical protein
VPDGVEVVGGDAGDPAFTRAAAAGASVVYQALNPGYEFEEPFVVDHGDFARAFGDHATPLEDATRTTVAWFHEHPRAPKR